MSSSLATSYSSGNLGELMGCWVSKPRALGPCPTLVRLPGSFLKPPTCKKGGRTSCTWVTTTYGYKWRSTLTNILVMHLWWQTHPDFITYQKTIICAYCRFSGDGWVIYDSACCLQAVNIKFLDWGQLDGHLWNTIFTGWAKAITHYRFCLSELHFHTDCPQAPDACSQSSGKQSWWKNIDRDLSPV